MAHCFCSSPNIDLQSLEIVHWGWVVGWGVGGLGGPSAVIPETRIKGEAICGQGRRWETPTHRLPAERGGRKRIVFNATSKPQFGVRVRTRKWVKQLHRLRRGKHHGGMLDYVMHAIDGQRVANLSRGSKPCTTYVVPNGCRVTS